MKTDEALNTLFAEHVAGIGPLGKWLCKMSWTTDANAVMPWLERQGRVEIFRVYQIGNGGTVDELLPLQWCIEIGSQEDAEGAIHGQATSFPRAAVLALLRAKGVEV